MTIRDLIFVRHGESEHHVNGLTGGWTDTPLTSRGVEQVRKTARYLASLDLVPTTIVASDLIRARQSAELIANELRAKVMTTPLLREINNGVAANLTLQEAEKIKHPEPTGRSIDYRPWDAAETFIELQLRADAALAHVETFDEDVHVVVGHGLAGQCLVRGWLGIELSVDISFHFDPASCTRLAINRWDEREIRFLNDCPWRR